jgi:hypothetical protein
VPEIHLIIDQQASFLRAFVGVEMIAGMNAEKCNSYYFLKKFLFIVQEFN